MNKTNLMTSIPKLREASMVQNTTQDTPEEIIDLTEIIQKGKIPSGGAKKGIDFDSALSDLQDTAKANSLDSTPDLDDLLAGLDEPFSAPSVETPAPGEGNATPGKNAPEKDLFDEFAEPAQPAVPSFDSLFADLGLAPPPEAPSTATTPDVLDFTDLPDTGSAETSASSPFSESIPGLDDVDALISKLDIPPSGGKKPNDDLQDLPDEQVSAPADLDSLLDSLLSAGGGKVQAQKPARGQPKEISEADLDDLLNSIEVESSGTIPASANVAESAPESASTISPVAEETLPVDLHPEKAGHDTVQSVGESPAGEASDDLGESTIDALFDALDTVSGVDPAQAEAGQQEPDLDTLVNFIELDSLLSTGAADTDTEKRTPAPSTPPSLSDVLSGKALATDSAGATGQDETADALFAGFDVPDEAPVVPVVSDTPGMPETPDTLAALADDNADAVEPLDPAAILAGVDELSRIAPTEQLSIPDTDELLERISILEAELTLLQSRVDALENTAAGEDLQSHLMDLLVEGSPFYARCVEIAQGIAEAAKQTEPRSQRETELEQRLLTVEDRQNDLDWGRQQGVSELENRFSEFENRFDVAARLEPLEERLATLEKKQRATDIEKRLAALEQAALNAPAPVEPVAPERMAEQMIELLRADIDKAAAESAARVLREEIAALISEQ